MSDAKCLNIDCPTAEGCYTFTSINEYSGWQSYFYGKPDSTGKCPEYKLDKEQPKKKRITITKPNIAALQPTVIVAALTL